MSKQKNNLINIITSLLNPKYTWIILNKIILRFSKNNKNDYFENLQWLKDNCSDLDTFCLNKDEELWSEALKVSTEIKINAQKILNNVKYDLGGGGNYPLLYFLVRTLNPKSVVETGVAAGFSSQSILKALEKNNNNGKLYSSDFPYFRIKNSEKYIGLIVDEKYKKNDDLWELHVNGDSNNLPKIMNKIDNIDILDYDSDKSQLGRSFAMSLIEKKMRADGIIIMDDIQDNDFFKRYLNLNKIENWKIFSFENKYVGIIGNIFD